MPSLSVIMPVFNAEKYIKKAIESVLNQTYTDFEFLIIDDCSTDKSIEIIELYDDKRIKLFKNLENIGSLKSRNILFEKCSSKLICFQDADDYSDLKRFEKLVSFMNEHQEVYICGSNANFYNQRGQLNFTSDKPLETEEIGNKFKTSIPILFASSIVRKDLFSTIGTFRDFFYDLGNYDYDWMYRVSEKYDCANIQDVLYHVNRHQDSNSLTIKNPVKMIGHKIVQFLAAERLNGKDSLEAGELKELKQFIESAVEPYINDPSKYIYDRIVGLLSEYMFKQAFIFSLSAIKKNPKSILNYRTTFYVLRKWILKVFKLR